MDKKYLYVFDNKVVVNRLIQRGFPMQMVMTNRKRPGIIYCFDFNAENDLMEILREEKTNENKMV